MDKLSKYLFFLVFIITTGLSCSTRPNEVLPRKEMESVMYDMYIAEAIIDNDYQNFRTPEKKEALINQVLAKHAISEARWDTSLSWYSDNIDQYLQINDSVKARLERNQKIAQQISMRHSELENEFRPKPSNYIPLNINIAGLGCNRGFKFHLDSTQLAEKFAEKDTIYFKFKALGLHPSPLHTLKSMLSLEYADTTIYQTIKIEENKSYSLPLSRHIENDTINSLNGFINLIGKMPYIPLQLYQISLGNNDSTQIINDSIIEIPEKEQIQQLQ